MTVPAPKKVSLSRTWWSSIMVAFIVVAVIAASLSPYALVVVLVVALIFAGLAYLRLRPSNGTGMGMLSTNCENCGSLLRGTMGLPSRKCPNCGHVQSWAK
jgi:hypothetical protein